MPHQVDQIHDTARTELTRLYKLYDFPEFVKKADIDKELAPRRMPEHLYADPVRKQYPCDTKEATWLSHVYFYEKKAEFHPKDQTQIEARLKHYAEYWRIAPQCKAAIDRWESLHKEADDKLADSDFAVVLVRDDGVKERHLRIKTAMEVKAACEYLEKYRDSFLFEQRHIAAKKILEKAARLGAAVAPHMDFLDKQAGRGVCSPTELVAEIRRRAGLVKDASLVGKFVEMADTIAKNPNVYLHPVSLVKLATTLDTLDRTYGLVERYNSGLPRPEDVVFSVTFSKTADTVKRHVATTTGKCYEKASFGKLALADIQGLLGDEFAQRVATPLGEVDPEKMAEEVATLPRPDAAMLDCLLSDNGIAPSFHKAAAARHGLARAEQEALAAAY